MTTIHNSPPASGKLRVRAGMAELVDAPDSKVCAACMAQGHDPLRIKPLRYAGWHRWWHSDPAQARWKARNGPLAQQTVAQQRPQGEQMRMTTLAVLMTLLLAGCDGYSQGSAKGTSAPDVKITKLDPLTPAQLAFIDGCAKASSVQPKDINNAVQKAAGLRQLGCLEITSGQWADYEKWRKDTFDLLTAKPVEPATQENGDGG